MSTVLGIVVGCCRLERNMPHITEQTKKHWKASVTATGSHCGLGLTLF